jgi:hypothetical protein
LAYPIYVIQPFRHQGPRELAAALAVIQARPFVDAACVVCAVVALLLFRAAEPRRARRILALIGTCLVCACVVLSRVNVYELMFHPAGQPAFVAAAQSKIDADDMVIAVTLNGDSHAYPIRSIAYHHIVNDVVSGEPIVATY